MGSSVRGSSSDFVNREDAVGPAPLEDGTSIRVRGTAMTEIHADELRPGDIVEYHGERHVICRIDRGDGAAWPVALDGTGWAIALGGEPVLVQRS
jgi:hypothetical protein